MTKETPLVGIVPPALDAKSAAALAAANAAAGFDPPPIAAQALDAAQEATKPAGKPAKPDTAPADPAGAKE